MPESSWSRHTRCCIPCARCSALQNIELNRCSVRYSDFRHALSRNYILDSAALQNKRIGIKEGKMARVRAVSSMYVGDARSKISMWCPHEFKVSTVFLQRTRAEDANMRELPWRTIILLHSRTLGLTFNFNTIRVIRNTRCLA